jgi:glycosyltransferase involved in cell wall biosynthesis
MKIGFLHRDDVADVTKLSGTPFYMAKALEEHVGTVVFLGPDTSLLTKAIVFLGKACNVISLRITGKRIASDHHRWLSMRLAKQFSGRIAAAGCDVLFAPMASAELAYLETSIPVVYLSDLTWAIILDYYPGASNLYGWAAREADRLESAAMHRANALIYPSQWAIESAIHDYAIPSNIIHLVRFGANFPNDSLPSQVRAIQHPLLDEIELLWVGVNWERKGGAVAFDCLLALLKMGLKARLAVCGCIPPSHVQHEKVRIIPFLDKNDPEQRQKLSDLFLSSHFLLFPTQAEAAGIVVCEASAHGLPALVRKTGGVGGVLRDGRNGMLLPPDATGADYAAEIVALVETPDRYAALVVSSRAEYEQYLNWDTWGEAVKPIFENVTASATSSPSIFKNSKHRTEVPS